MSSKSKAAGTKAQQEDAYLKDFHFIVTAGVTCGLQHPIEWAVNAYRTPGGSLEPEFYERMLASVPRFLCDMFYASALRDPGTAEEIIAWANKWYEKNPMAQDFFTGPQWRWPVDLVGLKDGLYRIKLPYNHEDGGWLGCSDDWVREASKAAEYEVLEHALEDIAGMSKDHSQRAVVYCNGSIFRRG